MRNEERSPNSSLEFLLINTQHSTLRTQHSALGTQHSYRLPHSGQFPRMRSWATFLRVDARGGRVIRRGMQRENRRTRSPADERAGRTLAMETAPLSYATPNPAHVRVGIVHRFLAGLVDAIVLAVLTVVPNLVLSKVSPMLAGIVGGVLALAYYSLEVLKAQSVGKMVFKLKITKQDGSPATQDQLIKRYAFKQVP